MKQISKFFCGNFCKIIQVMILVCFVVKTFRCARNIIFYRCVRFRKCNHEQKSNTFTLPRDKRIISGKSSAKKSYICPLNYCIGNNWDRWSRAQHKQTTNSVYILWCLYEGSRKTRPPRKWKTRRGLVVFLSSCGIDSIPHRPFFHNIQQMDAIKIYIYENGTKQPKLNLEISSVT